MNITVLVDNATSEGYCSEWGLSLHVQRGDTRVLLDFGQSGAFAQNAAKLGVDLAAVDAAVLSHAHYDHADGMTSFFAANAHAPLYLSDSCAENCWSTKAGTSDPHYIGIHLGLLECHAKRLRRVPTNQVTTIAPGFHVVPHTTAGLANKGQRDGMLLQAQDGWLPDGFAHEVTLVVELDDAKDAPLVILSSCSHAGSAAITDEVGKAFPHRKMAAFVGGLHLMNSSAEEVLRVARDIVTAGIEHVYTGHCTGDRALELLKRELPGRVTQLHPSLSIIIA